MADIKRIARKVDNLKQRYGARDARMSSILAIRKGKMTEVFPDFFPEGATAPMVSNFIDVAARDLAEVLAPLPSFNCATVKQNDDRAKKFADKRGMIANNYIFQSRFQTQMYKGSDWYFTYGFLPIHIEPDFETKLPRLRIEDPVGAYPEFDRFGRCVSYTKVYTKTISELVVDYPEYENILIGELGADQNMGAKVEIVRYTDKNDIILYVPSRKNLVLNQSKNPLGKMLVHVAVRPGVDEEPRGQFDDVMFVQLARARFANLAMEAAEKSIQSPLIVPDDVLDMPFGPDAIIRTQNPAGVGRVRLDVPSAAFQEQATLESELRLGSRYPEGRTGNINASIITGQGVQALLGAFDSQIKAGQVILSEVLEDVIKTCFELDEVLFDEKKSVRGSANGTPYELTYQPSRDIKGDHSVEVRYGLMAGLDPSRALIFSLQALGADLISKDFIRRELPWSMNVSEEEQKIKIEKAQDQLFQAIAGSTGAIPQMAAQGQDPSKLINDIASLIDMMRQGDSVDVAALKVFAPQPPAQPAQPEQQAGMVPPAPQAPVEQAPSQAVPGPASGGTAQPDLQTILAGMQGQQQQ